MFEYNSWDYFVFFVFIFMGLIGGVIGLVQFRNEKYYIEKWYIFFKGLFGLYATFIYIMVWIPYTLDDAWLARQCIRGIVLVALGNLILDGFMRKNRNRING